ncbi:hypothetical protein [Puia dinghuensis]|uniref:Uncharacterized protein n=1 Tax=Puia dinghuensis TaxID=1792502 RepID=A0A8J2XTP1_9BACT|nr:hypothetical protein [Puia dinghuensis]GGB00804.1 hypothetical protein GCM10011511_25120 [Puia dinghuensis]
MIHPHNPVMQRLGEMARLWQQKVQPEYRLVRWMLKPEESRMYEGFCRLEASPHGTLDNLFVFFYTPFVSAGEYSHALMRNWLQEYDENAEQRRLITEAGIKGEWNVATFRNAVAANRYEQCDALLLPMIRSYREWLGMPSSGFVLALLPKEMHSPAGFNMWLQTWMKQDIPDRVQLLLFDHVQGNFLGETFEEYKQYSCTLLHDLRMEQAVREIATAGAATDPQAAFRECLFEMGAAAAAKDRPRLEDWGEKALALGKKSGDDLLLATAFLSYAGMLFSFKAHEKIESLLDGGFRVCRRGVDQQVEAMRSLLLQYYAYRGSHCQLRRQRKEALDWFMRMGRLAEDFGYWSQALSAYYKAFVFARYKHFDEEKAAAMSRAMGLTDRLSAEEIVAGEYPFMALAFVQEGNPEDGALRLMVEEKMLAAFGVEWRETVEALEKNYTRQKANVCPSDQDAPRPVAASGSAVDGR